MHTPPSSSITITTPITITPLPPTIYVGVSLSHIYIPFSTPILTDSTIPPSSTFTRTLEVTVTKSVSEEVDTSGIHVNISDMGADANIGVTNEPVTSTTSTTFDFDPDILFGDDQEMFEDFFLNVSPSIKTVMTMKPLMSKGQYKQLNEKLDSIL